MTILSFFFLLIPILGIILLAVTFILAPHEPYKEKETPFECGYHSFLQTRTQFAVSFFLIGLLFLLFDLEIVLIYPFSVSFMFNGVYGLITIVIFILVLTLGFVFEIGKKALNIESKSSNLNSSILSPKVNIFKILLPILLVTVFYSLLFYWFNVTLSIGIKFLIGMSSVAIVYLLRCGINDADISYYKLCYVMAIFIILYLVRLHISTVDGRVLYDAFIADGLELNSTYTEYTDKWCKPFEFTSEYNLDLIIPLLGAALSDVSVKGELFSLTPKNMTPAFMGNLFTDTQESPQNDKMSPIKGSISLMEGNTSDTPTSAGASGTNTSGENNLSNTIDGNPISKDDANKIESKWKKVESKSDETLRHISEKTAAAADKIGQDPEALDMAEQQMDWHSRKKEQFTDHKERYNATGEVEHLTSALKCVNDLIKVNANLANVLMSRVQENDIIEIEYLQDVEARLKAKMDQHERCVQQFNKAVSDCKDKSAPSSKTNDS